MMADKAPFVLFVLGSACFLVGNLILMVRS